MSEKIAQAESLADALARESLEVAKVAAREWAATLNRAPSRRELAAFMAGHLAAQGIA